jgi:hypothetical protein
MEETCLLWANADCHGLAMTMPAEVRDLMNFRRDWVVPENWAAITDSSMDLLTDYQNLCV